MDSSFLDMQLLPEEGIGLVELTLGEGAELSHGITTVIFASWANSHGLYQTASTERGPAINA
jgi:hypothetical protein